MGTLFVSEIWRYPVKSMAGEALTAADVGLAGIPGDRVVQVFNGSGRVVTARTHPGLLGHRATIDPSGEPLVDGRPWTDAAVLADVRRIVGPDARLARHRDPAVRFDMLPLLVATDGAIAAFGRDGRRLRPNLVIGGVTGLEERRWPGSRLRIGEVVIEVDSLRGRCVMTTVDPDSLEQDPGVLRDIVERFGGRLALNCAVLRGGTIRVGQPVELVDATAPEPLSHQAASQHLKVHEGDTMAKHIACGDLIPGCSFTASAASDEELVKKVVAHATHAHGVTEVTPELAAKVQAAIKTDAGSR